MNTDLDPRRIYVSNIEFSTTQEELEGLFSSSGPVVECEIVRRNGTNESRGFAFVTFADEQSASIAVTEYHNYKYKGRNLVVRPAEPKVPFEERQKHTPARYSPPTGNGRSEQNFGQSQNQGFNQPRGFDSPQVILGVMLVPGYPPPPPGYMFVPIPGYVHPPQQSHQRERSSWLNPSSTCEVIHRRNGKSV